MQSFYILCAMSYSIAFQESWTLSALHLQESFGCRLCQKIMSYFNIFQAIQCAVYSANVGYVSVCV